MRKILLLTALFSASIHSPVLAKDNQQYTKAKQNFEKECVRGLATPVLLKNKVQKHSFQIQYTTDDFPLIYGLETAQLENGQSIRLENVGCESYGFDIQLILNAQNIEKNHKLCQSCLIQELKRIAVYFQTDDRGFYLYGIKALEQQFSKYKTLKVNAEYQLKGSEEMPQTFSFGKITKQKNGQYLVSFLNSVGPL
ncbi:hypothetical protein [Acinetobacter wuhouensis]|uniref:DUF4892 domain-containing protein n=1 Tax=Acinetobacter wuhouensis TaxID=1879050 RepID=A0A3G2T7U3_9GAMM|nr:hypothetical protein [Acinetobacter wuhouensis]AYO55536.1 hypothetical protein CDG68_18620 [Acinetobacter wuhouensis]